MTKELPVWVQYAAFFLLWSIWAAAVALVAWHSQAMAPDRYYVHPVYIKRILLAAFPAVIAALGMRLLLRTPRGDGAPRRHRASWAIARVLTGIALAFLATLGLAALLTADISIRE